MWLLGVCGGGDVKLFTGLGAWLGSYLLFLVLVATAILMCGCLIVAIGGRLVRGKGLVLANRGKGRANTRGPVVVRFSVVAAVATLLVVLWAFRTDLGFVPPHPSVSDMEVSSHAR
jgi:Flp pilus assembly protein protease CpaA